MALEHHFNHDICLSAEDQAIARTRWPLLAPALIDPALPSAFLLYEGTASRHKRLVHQCGIACVLLAVVSLLGTGAHMAGFEWAARTAPVFGLAAVGSFLTAFVASRYWTWRRKWMAARFATEVLRNHHFADFLNDGIEVAAGSAVRTQRSSLKAVAEDLDRSAVARMAAFMEGDRLVAVPHRTSRLPPHDEVRRQALDAYFTLRLQHQLDYASYATSDADRSVLGMSGSLAVKISDMLAGVTLVGAIILAFATSLHLSDSRWLPAGTLALLLTGVALRALRDGLAVGEDQHRYRQYGHTLSMLKERWSGAKTDEDYLRIADEVERAAEAELRAFLLTHQSAQFLF